MFSHNGRISEKQMRFMLVLYIFMSVIFVLPHLFAKMFGRDIIAGIALFCILSAIYTGAVMCIGKNGVPDESLESHKNNTLFTSVMVIRYVIRLVFYILLSVSVLAEGQVPFMNKTKYNSFTNLLILLPLILVALYGAVKEIEKQGRISEMLFRVAIFPYVLMILFGIKEWRLADGLNIIPGQVSTGKMFFYCYSMLCFILPIEIYPWLILKTKTGKMSSVKSYMSVMGIILLAGLISILMAGIYGVGGMSEDAMASVSIMRYIELPFGVLRRFDVLMVWFFMTGCFILLGNTLFYIRRMLSEMTGIKNLTVAMTVVVILSCVLAYICPEYEISLNDFIIYGALVDMPLSVIMLIAAKCGRRLKKLMTMVVMGLLVTLNGCSPDIENIEQRDYATVMMISPSKEGNYQYTVTIAKEHRHGQEDENEEVFLTDAKDIDNLSQKYAKRKGKELSLSHLKVILISPAYLKICDVLRDLDEADEVAKTCPLIFVSDKKQLEKYLKASNSPVGTYISNLIDVRKRSDKTVTKLMDYLKCLRDKTAVEPLFLEVKEGDLTIKSINE